jgi:hypothetical protein
MCCVYVYIIVIFKMDSKQCSCRDNTNTWLMMLNTSNWDRKIGNKLSEKSSGITRSGQMAYCDSVLQ